MSVLNELLGQLPTYSEAYGRGASIPYNEWVNLDEEATVPRHRFKTKQEIYRPQGIG
jgi:hypothetical protein